MKKILAICLVLVFILSVSGTAGANTVTLVFDANDIFDYATSNDTMLNQQGTARAIWGKQGETLRTTLDLNLTGETGRYYQTYNDGVDPYDRMGDATAAQDLQSVENILSWTAQHSYQGINWMQLYLQGGSGSTLDWGERIVWTGSGSMTPSVNGEFGWRIPGGYGDTPVYDTLLGSNPNTNWNAISPDANPAEKLFSVTGDFFYDTDGSGTFNAGDTDLVLGQDYTIWFFAKLSNYTYIDDYGNGIGGNPGYIEGTLMATAVPIPGAVWLLGAGLFGLVGIRKKLRS